MERWKLLVRRATLRSTLSGKQPVLYRTVPYRTTYRTVSFIHAIEFIIVKFHV